MAHMKEFKHLKIHLEAIILATNNFADENCIGRGGFGNVYIGEIVHSTGQKTIGALKRLDRKFGQGDPEFWKEIMMLSLYKHENIVSLLGYCDESGEKILVYEYVSKKSLDQYLHNDELTWAQRLKICIGAARGLAYLHNPPFETQQSILHRDIKSANILLDENWNAKISDFGLSKFGPTDEQISYLISHPVGTIGYCDPLYAESGVLTKGSDVYSFGVVLFEVFCGRLCKGNDYGGRPLIGLVREFHKENKLSELICSHIKGEVSSDSLNAFTEIAYQCLQREREERPSMNEIVRALESAFRYQCPDDPEAEVKTTAAELNAKEEAKKRKQQGILRVNVIRTEFDVSKVVAHLSRSRIYLIVTLKDFNSDIGKTSVKPYEVNTEWNEVFTLPVEYRPAEILQIHLLKIVSVHSHSHLGYASANLGDFTPDILETLDLAIMDKRAYCICKLQVQVQYSQFPWDQIPRKIKNITAMQKALLGAPKGKGLLIVIIRRADLNQVKETPDASVLLYFHGELRNTLCIMHTKTPIWEQEFTYMLDQPPRKDKMRLEIINNNTTYNKDNKTIGFCEIGFADVIHKKRIVKSYFIESTDFVAVENEVFRYRYKLEVELQWGTSGKIPQDITDDSDIGLEDGGKEKQIVGSQGEPSTLPLKTKLNLQEKQIMESQGEPSTLPLKTKLNFWEVMESVVIPDSILNL